jgi:hypothetical protein
MNLFPRSDFAGKLIPFLAFIFVANWLIPVDQSAAWQAKNSTAKNRTQPTQTAQRIGSAVNWQPDFESAVAESKKTGKPIFWYVPTLPDTFMDRQKAVHRYMLAGPFSWPAIIDSINKHSIPLKRRPTPAQQNQYELKPYKFVEPGFIVIQPNGAKSFSVDHLTTLHPDWLLELIRHGTQADPANATTLHPTQIQPFWDAFATGQFEKINAAFNGQPTGPSGIVSLKNYESGTDAELDLLHGMVAFRLGKHAQAKQIWQKAASDHADHPLGWKAAAEAQMIGPFSRGFESHSHLPAAAMAAGVQSIGSAAPKNIYDEKELHCRGIAYLLSMQNQNGAFHDSDYDFGGFDSLGNVHVAVTSIAGTAMVATSNHFRENDDKETDLRSSAISSAVKSTIEFVTDTKNINKYDRDEILWAYAYRLRFLLSSLRSESANLNNAGDLSAAIKISIDSLQSIQGRRGNWYHEYNNPFVTANALIALKDADEAGFDVDKVAIVKGLENLLNDRFDDGSFPYYSSKRKLKNKPSNQQQLAGAAGRMPLCELALFRWGKSSDERLKHAVATSFEYHRLLKSAYKYDNHTSNYGYGGFFFWYDMKSRTEAISYVADATTRKKYYRQQKALIMSLPEVDGCFVDSHELGRVYGTAMALICLAGDGVDANERENFATPK